METFLTLLSNVLPTGLVELIKTTSLTPAQEAVVVKACLEVLQLTLSSVPFLLERGTKLMSDLATTVAQGLKLEDSTAESPNQQTIDLYQFAESVSLYSNAFDASVENLRSLVESYADSKN